MTTYYGAATPESTAALQVDSTTEGVLVPRMTTTQRNAISSPAESLLIFNTTTNRLEWYDDNNTAWQGLAEQTATKSIFFDANLIYPATTSGCAALAKVNYATNAIDLNLLDFDQTSIEYAQFTLWMPDDWDASTVTFQAAWTAAAGTPAQTVEWNLEGRAYADDDAIDQAWGTAVEVSDALLATGDIHYAAESAAVTLAGTPAAGELCQFRVWRDATNDTLAGDARLIGIKLYYTLA